MMHLSIPRALGLIAVLAIILQCTNASAQLCPNGTPWSTKVFTTIKTGNSTDPYTLSMFDPNIGTLYKVNLTAKIYLRAVYTLTNTGPAPESYTVGALREDSVYVYSKNHPQQMPVETGREGYFLKFVNTPAVPVGVSKYDTAVWNPRTYTQSFDYSQVAFLGNDSIFIRYQPLTLFSTPSSSPNIAISNNSIKDSSVFTITYSYCPTATLASATLTLTSRPQDSNVVLSWTSEDRYSQGTYEILKSKDGRSYTSINKQPIDRNQLKSYNYLYQPLAADGSVTFFRIKQTSTDGDVTYSRIISVPLTQNNNALVPIEAAKNKLTVFPSLAKGFVNVALPEGNANDEWQVSIVSLAGQVLQNTAFKGNGQFTILFNNPLPAGMHIVNAVNKRTNESYKGKIIVQN